MGTPGAGVRLHNMTGKVSFSVSQVYRVWVHFHTHCRLKKLSDQQTIINRKLDLVITKDDLKDSLIQIKQDILSTVQEKIDKLEAKLFQTQLETDELNKENIKLKQDNVQLKQEIKAANVTV